MIDEMGEKVWDTFARGSRPSTYFFKISAGS